MRQRNYDMLSKEEKNAISLTSMEMQHFYTLRTKERQAVLNRIIKFKEEQKP